MSTSTRSASTSPRKVRSASGFWTCATAPHRIRQVQDQEPGGASTVCVAHAHARHMHGRSMHQVPWHVHGACTACTLTTTLTLTMACTSTTTLILTMACTLTTTRSPVDLSVARCAWPMDAQPTGDQVKELNTWPGLGLGLELGLGLGLRLGFGIRMWLGLGLAKR